MKDCHDCTEAMRRTWGGYRADCPGCTARAIARSLAAWRAITKGEDADKKALRELIAKLLPKTSTTEARRMVFGWWNADRQASSLLSENQ